ncbi:MAG: hypothetical protein Q9170_006919 [Blastenia crenularia]
MAIVSIDTDVHLTGAAGRPFLSTLIKTAFSHFTLNNTTDAIILPAPPKMSSSHPTAPKLQVNGLTSISEHASPSTTAPTDRNAMRLNMLRKIRPPPFRYAWVFYHEKNLPAPDPSTPSSTTTAYEDRLTTMLENIITIKTFWELVNTFPLQNLKMKDSIHFFKRGVRPVWEDPRNVEGGAWTFRVSKSVSGDFWVEVLLLAVGEQFSDVIGKGRYPFPPTPPTSTSTPPQSQSNKQLTQTSLPTTGDDICGLSLARRFNSDLITIWNRRSNNQASIDGIRDVVLAQLSPNLKPKEGTYYYKRHEEHAGFSEVVAAAKMKRDEGKGLEEVAKVEDKEAEMVMVREAEEEGVRVEEEVDADKKMRGGKEVEIEERKVE